jgi:hypothetical protein
VLAALAFHWASSAWAVRPIFFAFQQSAGFASVEEYEAFYEIDGYLFLLSPSPDMAEASVVDSFDLPDAMLDEFGLPRVGGDGTIRISVEGSDEDVYKAIRAYSGDQVSPPSNVVLQPRHGAPGRPRAVPEPPAGPAGQDPGVPADPEGSGLREIIDAYESLSSMLLDLERDFEAHLGAARTRDDYLRGYATIFESAYLPRLDALDLDARQARPELAERDRREYRNLARDARKVRKLAAILHVAPKDAELDATTKERLRRTFSRKVTKLLRSIDRRIARQERRLDEMS